MQDCNDDLEAQQFGVASGMSIRGAPRLTFKAATFHSLNALKDAPSVQKAVGVMDSLGNQFGYLLRTKSTVRIGFIVYILLLHIWVAFVFYHFLHRIN